MFRKPKRPLNVKDHLRQRKSEEVNQESLLLSAQLVAAAEVLPPQVLHREEGDHDDEPRAETEVDPTVTTTRELVSEARKRLKVARSSVTSSAPAAAPSAQKTVLPSYETDTFLQEQGQTRSAERATRSTEAHPLPSSASSATTSRSSNANWAGPLRAAAHVRITARFDYQPDICKDYRETGFCGYGDTCIYLHDRGDTLTGWQLDQQWEQQQQEKRRLQEQQVQDFLHQVQGGNDAKHDDKNASVDASDGFPFACFLCRDYFKQPVVTTCQHYFCESCIMNHVRTPAASAAAASNCPVCSKDTGGVFNHPTKLVAKKRRVLGSAQAAADDSWQQYAQVMSGRPSTTHEQANT